MEYACDPQAAYCRSRAQVVSEDVTCTQLSKLHNLECDASTRWMTRINEGRRLLRREDAPDGMRASSTRSDCTAAYKAAVAHFGSASGVALSQQQDSGVPCDKVFGDMTRRKFARSSK